MTELSPAGMDRLLAVLELAQGVEAAALCAMDPDALHGDESVLAGRDLLEALLPDVPGSAFGGYATEEQLTVVRSVVGDYPMHEVAPDRVYMPELRAVLRRWASAEHRRAQVLVAS